MSGDPWQIINDINAGKISDDIDAYNPYITNRFFSFFPDTLYYAQLINQNHNLDPVYQYFFLINTIRPAKRFQKWLKREENADIDVVREYYGYTDVKAKEALLILTEEQLETIRQRIKGE